MAHLYSHLITIYICGTSITQAHWRKINLGDDIILLEVDSVRPGMIVRHVDTGICNLVIGSIANIIVLGWNVKEFSLPAPRQGYLGFAVGTGECLTEAPVWINPLEIDNYEVLPTVIASPAHLFLVNRRKVHKYSGIGPVQTSVAEDLYTQAARHCFYQIPLHQLKTLCAQFGLSPPSPDLLGHLQALLACLLPDLSPDETRNILMMRAILPVNPLADIITDDMMLEELVATDELKVFQEWLTLY